MSESVATANVQQNTPSGNDLDAQMAADEASRHIDDVPEEQEIEEQEEEVTDDHVEHEQVEEEHPKHEKENEFEKRLARFAFEKREAQKRARQLEEENLRLRGQAPPETKDAEFERRVAEAAEQRMYQRQEQLKIQATSSKGDEIYRAGVTEYADFADAINNFKVNELPISHAIIEAASEVENPHKLFYHLGKNIDEAERIFNLPPHQMGVALYKVAEKLNKPKAQSRVPPPIKPLAGKGSRSIDVSNMSTDEYMKFEEEKRKANAGRRSR